MTALSPLVMGLAGIAHDAGRLILKYYAAGTEARVKSDSSPVTDADQAAEALILAGLRKLAPGIPIIAEEEMAAGRAPRVDDRFFLVDPLDGTKEFLQRNGEFTVNIALIENRRPLCGVVLAPALARLFIGDGTNGAYEMAVPEIGALDFLTARSIRARVAPADGLTVAVSRSHRDAATDSYLAPFRVAHRIEAGSSLKFCLIAAGEADLYPRLGRTMEWDIGAGHAVVEAAGGSVTMFDGAPLLYGKVERGFDNPHFVAKGRA